MAQEQVFDDVAFYFVMCSMFGVFLVPLTAFYMLQYLYNKVLCPPKKRGAASSKFDGAVLEKLHTKESKGSFFTWKRILFVGGWLVFIALLVQLPSMQGEELASFDPYKILEVEYGEAESVIKKAYRKKSLKWHPDKNPNNPEAEKMFLLVSKAYQALTDPDAGPTGPMGSGGGAVSVAVGLPSILTLKHNHLPVLILYFFLFIVLPPSLVFIWWRKARNFHQTGIMHETVMIYNKFVTQEMRPRFLLDILAASAEFRQVARSRVNAKEGMQQAAVSVKAQFRPEQAKFKRPYIVKSLVLLHVHLLRKKLPESLTADMQIILGKSHKLLMTLLDILWLPNTEKRRWLAPGFAAVQLQQCLTQALWLGSSPYQQLPHFTEKIDKACRRKWAGKGSQTVGFREMIFDTPEARAKVFSKEGLTDDQIKEVEEVIVLLPRLEVKHEIVIEGEADNTVYDGDIVKVVVDVKRLFHNAQENTPEEKKEEKQKEESKEGKLVEQDDEMSVEEREAKLCDELPTVPKKPRKAESLAPVVYAPRFPWVKREGWVVALIMRPPQGKKGGVVIGHKLIMDLDEAHKCDFYLRAPPAGKYRYEVQLMSDSYIACDVAQNINMEVKPQPTKDQKRAAGQHVDDSDDEWEEEEEVWDPKWYYLWHESLFELLMNALVLYLMGLFAVNWLQTRGYWEPYCQPILDKIAVYTGPPYAVVSQTLAPVVGPIWAVVSSAGQWLADKLTKDVRRDFDEL